MQKLAKVIVMAGALLGTACSEHHAAAEADGATAGGAAGVGAMSSGAAEAGGAPGGGAGAGGISGAAGDTAVAGAACGGDQQPNNWASWVMPNPAQSGLPNPASYAVSESGNQVTDQITGLTWQRNVDSGAMPWDAATRYCACLTLDGDGDWRLPSRIELASLVDWTAVSPSIDSATFPSTTNENFWTSSVVITDPGLVYLVFFLNGHTTYAAFDYEYRARCVRSSTTALTEHYTVANGTVYDTQTRLTWQQAFPTDRYTWPAAKTYCEGLALDGTGWRVPSINELQTLVDDSTNPSIDLMAFPMTPSEYFWSSSAVVDDASRAWTTFFTNGSTYSFATTASKNVRCVR
jgi:Protein of unknown function (DUF1566)